MHSWISWGLHDRSEPYHQVVQLSYGCKTTGPAHFLYASPVR